MEMPETSYERRGEAQPQHDKIIKLKEPCPPPPPPPTGNQSSTMEGTRQKQQRPSVLRQVTQAASRRQHVHPESSAAVSICKEEVDAVRRPPSPSPHMGPSSKQSSIQAMLHDGSSLGPKSEGTSVPDLCVPASIPKETSALFVRGLCGWPGCDVTSEDFPRFLKHLHCEHSHGDRSIAQWKVQQDMVQCMESQLILEKQKLIAMQLHLHLSEHRHTDLAASEWPYSLPLFLPRPQVTDGDRGQQWGIRHLEELSQHGSPHILPDLVPSIECYKHNNIRPPYTYAYLIRWSILESLDQQRTLNDIYNWFTTMFFYFRHNTATWKNAVRHNLSLHKCFVRVEGGKGAVWTVDEAEYQRRKGQKYHRDCPVKWLASYPPYGPEDP
ncbi:forkhead box protein P3 isoform X2 [Cyclopterus lumpus]|uniref:forkhead box protein P3 isoform X2 n=1 Tax=Cyclopterus lumpus TaxID=8103 RepID=UPI0014872BB3|nr:forkhead box protein P3 isoform X2 [Cyclopterus lumpus]XP_034393197.1 forkhead box protein P3 isoform X2 [Cyclopterus lumpus]